MLFGVIFVGVHVYWFLFFFFKQKTAYEMRISDWSSDVCSSDLRPACSDRGQFTRDELARLVERGAALASDLAAFDERAEHRIEPEEKGRAQHESGDDILAGDGEQPRQPHFPRMLVGIMVEPRDRKSTRLNSSH